MSALVLAEASALMMDAVVERWRFVSTDGKDGKKTLRPPAPLTCIIREKSFCD